MRPRKTPPTSATPPLQNGPRPRNPASADGPPAIPAPEHPRHNALATPRPKGQKRRMREAGKARARQPAPPRPDIPRPDIPRPDILCIGSVLWDVIGHSPSHMAPGADVPGRITRQPGGVALNIALTLTRFSLTPALLTVLGRDREGRELAAACTARGLVMDHAHLSGDLPTDRYMAIEAANGLVAAIADARSLEAAGAQILAPLRKGPLATTAAPWEGPIALDGNLTEALLGEIATDPAFARADLRIAPASPGKAARLLPLISHPRATFYLNREEAGILCAQDFPDAARAAEALKARGAHRVVVTDGAAPCALRDGEGLLTLAPPEVPVARVTGAGDTFMAAHIAAEIHGRGRRAALRSALGAAARHVSGETPP